MSIGPPPSSLTELVLCLIQLVNKSTAVEKAILLFLAAVLFYAAANKLWQFSLPATALNLSSGTAVLIAMIEISVGTANCIGQPTALPFCLSCEVGCGPVGTVPCAGICSGGWCYCACGMGAAGTLRCTCR